MAERKAFLLRVPPELYEALELTIDKSQDAANTLEGIVLKNA